MLKFDPIESKKIWGRELWLASTHRDGKQEDFARFLGSDYPLIVKVIQANSALSVQVHPDDEQARILEGENESGKSECWYVLDAADGASLVYGLSGNVKRETLKNAIQNGKLEDYLRYVKVKKGDFLFIPAGTVHAIGGGLRLLEVQQASNTTYRLYDYNRGRELHVEKALAVIKNSADMSVKPFADFSCDYFSLKKHEIAGDFSMNKSENVRLFFVINAKNGSSASSDSNVIPLFAQDIIAVSSREAPVFHGNLSIMEISART